MKKLILLTFILLSSVVFAGPGGDGTLPVIRSVEVSFVDGNLPRLPDTINLELNVLLKKNEEVIKKIDLKQLALKQNLKLKNINGELKIEVASKAQTTQDIIKSLLQQVESNIHFNELLLPDQSKLTQSIKVNFK